MWLHYIYKPNILQVLYELDMNYTCHCIHMFCKHVESHHPRAKTSDYTGGTFTYTYTIFMVINEISGMFHQSWNSFSNKWFSSKMCGKYTLSRIFLKAKYNHVLICCNICTYIIKTACCGTIV